MNGLIMVHQLVFENNDHEWLKNIKLMANSCLKNG